MHLFVIAILSLVMTIGIGSMSQKTIESENQESLSFEIEKLKYKNQEYIYVNSVDFEEAYQKYLSDNALIYDAIAIEMVAEEENLSRQLEEERELADNIKPKYNISLAEEYQDYIFKKTISEESFITYELMLAMIFCESTFNNDSTNTNKNGTIDVGFCQINSVNHDSMKVKYGLDDLRDPYQNIDAGFIILNNLMKKYGDETIALIAYNMGETGMRRITQTQSTTGYSKKVLQKKQELIENGGL
jgi:hypothetical protein